VKLIPWLMLLLVAGGLVWWQSASAYMPLIAWTHPTTNTNGTALPLAQIQGTVIQYGTCNGTDFGTPLHSFEIVGTKNRATGPNIQPGIYCYRLATRTAAGLSAWSVVVKLVVADSTCGSGCH
jgi:hypothetical protein